MNKEELSIFAYIIENLKEDGSYNGEPLIDDPTPSLPRPFGSDDAYIYNAEIPADRESAEAVLRMLNAYSLDPSSSARAILEESIRKVPCITVCDPLVDMLALKELPKELLALAEDWLYTSHKRELVKYAIVILSVFGLEKLRDTHSKELWTDLVTIARCEEFTFFLTFAYRINNIKPQAELWQLVRLTKGWGRLFTLYDLVCDTPAEEKWILQHGCELEIDYPPACLVVMRKGQIMRHLAHITIDYPTYRGCLKTIHSYIMMLDRYVIGNENPSQIDISDINTAGLLYNLLRHSENYVSTPYEIIDLVKLSFALQQLITEDNWAALTPNTTHDLIGICEKLIYSRDWSKAIDANLFKSDGTIDYTIAEFAFEIEVDVWDRLFTYLEAHPLETNLFPYLLGADGEEHQKKVLTFIEKNINLYSQSETALLIPIKYLEAYPGKGLPIIMAALTSFYDWPRGAAAIILDQWGHEYLTPPLVAALISARKLSQHPLITMRIDALLEHKPFNTLMMQDQFDEN